MGLAKSNRMGVEVYHFQAGAFKRWHDTAASMAANDRAPLDWIPER